ncbi:MAG: DNA polymerase III subunit delta [Angelakisella sp.]
MQLTGDRALEKWYRENNLPLCCLLYGEDDYQIGRQRDKLIKLAVRDFADFNLYTADGRVAVNMDELCDSAFALPFMSESRAVVLDDLDMSQQDASGVDKLFQLLKSPPESTCIIITVRTTLMELKKKSSRTAKLWDYCDKVGIVCAFPKPNRNDIARAASTRAVKAGCKLDSAAAGLLADYCGGDMLRALSETDKLIAYTGQSEISVATVELLVEPVIEAKVFDLSGKLLNKDLDGAMGIVSDLIFQRESPVSILTILSMSFADIYRASAAKRAGVPMPQACKELGYFGGSTYRLQKAGESQSRLSQDTLGEIVLLLARADSAMKETAANPTVILETAVTQIYLLCSANAIGGR